MSQNLFLIFQSYPKQQSRQGFLNHSFHNNRPKIQCHLVNKLILTIILKKSTPHLLRFCPALLQKDGFLRRISFFSFNSSWLNIVLFYRLQYERILPAVYLCRRVFLYFPHSNARQNQEDLIYLASTPQEPLFLNEL